MTSPTQAAETVADGVLELLRDRGIEYVFTCPGTTEVPLLLAAGRCSSPKLVLTTHESSAVAMADGYARATGKPGAVLLHANVGLTNGLAMLYAAQIARTPLLVLNGIKPTALHNRRALTFTPNADRLAAPFCKDQLIAVNSNSVLDEVSEAIEAALQEPTGPVYVGIPQDLLSAGRSGTSIPARRRRKPQEIDKLEVQAALAALRDAKRPVLVAGAEVARTSSGQLLEALAAHLGAPVVDPPWRDLEWAAVNSDHPNYAGIYRRDDPIVESADLVTLVGCEPFLESEPGPEGDDGLPATARLHLGPVMNDSTMIPDGMRVSGDLNSLLTCLLSLITGTPADTAPATVNYRRLLKERVHKPQDGPTREQAASGTVHITTALEVLASRVDIDTTVVMDAVTATSALLELLPRREGKLFATGSGSLGWGLGAAVGVALADRERRVLAVVGDGAFQFGMQAVWTAASMQLPVTWVVLNNSGYHAVRAAVARADGTSTADSHPMANITGVDYAKIAAGLGASGARIASPEELEFALAEAKGARGPHVLDVRLHGGVTNPVRS